MLFTRLAGDPLSGKSRKRIPLPARKILCALCPDRAFARRLWAAARAQVLAPDRQEAWAACWRRSANWPARDRSLGRPRALQSGRADLLFSVLEARQLQ